MKHDKIETIGKGSIIHHGKSNDRIYLMKLHKQDAESIIDQLSLLAAKNKYAKIFCKVPKSLSPLFTSKGYMLEAFIPEFYNRSEDVFFMSKFLNSDRLLNIENKQLELLSKLLDDNPERKESILREEGYTLKKTDSSNIQQITELYGKVFKTYPFPIHEPDYILETMNENVQYFGVEKDGKLAALASSEIDFKSRNAEMTDFATHPDHTGKNLSCDLLQLMETEMKKQDITCLYTIARLNSIAMNKTFIRSGYNFSGTLIKNTNIAGNIESMNVYYKHL